MYRHVNVIQENIVVLVFMFRLVLQKIGLEVEVDALCSSLN